MDELPARYILLFTSLFVIVDPIGTVPLLLGLTEKQNDAGVRAVIRRAVFFAAGLLVIFALAGAMILELLRINLDAFRIAGGVLLFLTALQMMRGTSSAAQCNRTDPNESRGGDVSFVPLGMPSLAGPGALTTVVIFSTDHTSDHLVHSLLLVAAIGLVFLLSYWILRFGARARRWLGDNAQLVLNRVMGLFIAALSIQFAVEGVMRLVAGFQM